MPTHKNAAIRYRTLDKCFRDRPHQDYTEEPIDKCEEALLYDNGIGCVGRRQIFEDIKLIENDTGWSIPLERIKNRRKGYYRYYNALFTINEQSLTNEEVRPTDGLQEQNLSFGSDVEVLSPDSCRTEIKEKLKETLKKYFAMQKDCTDGQ